MKLGESFFDIGYLILVIAFGVRLLLEKNKEAKLFGIMAILLGAGDSFHLLPRVISHLSPGGFEANLAALSWGKFVTSITMTIFYVLYYYFYRSQSKDLDNKKKILVYGLAIIRIILVLMPANNWGGANESYIWGIYRNIPFAILGLVLIIWSYKEKEKPGLKHMWWLILLSFAFYIPVVLFADKYPGLGALMMPKTLAYLFIVIFGFNYFVREDNSFSILANSLVFLIMGIMGGVFSREFNKLYNFTEFNYIRIVHTHSLTLGFFLGLIFYLLVKNYDKEKIVSLKKSYHIYMTGLVITIISMMLGGIYTVVSQGENIINPMAVSLISGIGHSILTVALISNVYKIYKFENIKKVII